jgi:hypothetical protein
MQEFHELTKQKGLDLASVTGEELVDAISDLLTRNAVYKLAEEYVGHQADLVGEDQWPSSCFAWQDSKDGLMGMMFECLLDEIENTVSGSPYAAHVRRKLMERYGFDATSVPPVLIVREYMGLMVQARKVRDKGPGCLCGPKYHAMLWGKIDKLASSCDRPEDAATVDRERIMQILEDVL